MEAEKIEKVKKHSIDLIVIFALVVISLSVFFVSQLTREDGEVAVVEIDGVYAGEYSLLIDGEFVLNGGTNVLVIEGGEAYINYSSCPTHTCEIGKIRHVGERIVCLPNRVSIVIRGEGGVEIVS